MAKKTLYLGYSMKEFNRIRDLLDAAGIPYTYRLADHQTKLLEPRSGVIRGAFGNQGTNQDYSSQYEILVSKEHYEKASYVMKCSD